MVASLDADGQLVNESTSWSHGAMEPKQNINKTICKQGSTQKSSSVGYIPGANMEECI